MQVAVFALRIYVAALTFVTAVAFAAGGEVAAQHYIVGACPLLYMILEMREELAELDSLERVGRGSSS